MERDPNLPGILFHALHRAHMNAVQAELNVLGLEGLGSPLLMMLLQSRGRDGEIPSQRELAKAMRVSPAAVAMALKTLGRLGYVERRIDEHDQRRKRITVTEQGASAVEKCWAALQAIDARMMEGFTAGEREHLNAYHRRMLQNLTGLPDGWPEHPFEERMECQCSKP